MIDKIDHIFLVRPEAQDVAILGALPSLDVRRDLADMLQPRPAARKQGAGLIASIPLHAEADKNAAKVWAFWQFGAVPTVTELPRVLTNLAEVSRGFSAVQAGAPPPPKLAAVPVTGPVAGTDTTAAIEDILADLPARRRRNGAVLTARLAGYLSEHTGSSSIAVFPVRAARSGRAWPSDARLKPVLAQLRTLFDQRLAAARVPTRIEAASDAVEDFEAAMILQRLGAHSMNLYFPSGDFGYGMILLDAKDGDHGGVVQDAAGALQMSRPMSSAPLLTQNRKRALGAAAALLALWLVWPAPTWLTVVGTSIPDAALTVSLPSDATLQQMFVRVGNRVAAGAPIAQLFSAQLEERRAQEALSIKVEELAAQAAMAENNFGAFQLAEQRREIAKTRLAQVEARIAQLAVVSPADGLIVSAIPDNTKGAALPVGTALAQVQTAPKFLVRLNPARVDARLMAAGQGGQIYFRGLSDRTYQVTLITPPVAIIDPNTNTEKLEAYAQIITPDDGRLMGGLAGYARIAAPNQMRILSLTRHVREYIRVKAWTFLGLPL